MIVFYDAARELISVEGTGAVWPPRSLVAVSDGSGISIMLPDGVTRVLGPLTPAQVEQPQPNGPPTSFADVASAMAYLADTFARPARLYQDVLTITTQNVIQPLSFAWKSAPGCFANIIVGSATFPNGGGVVSFTDGSTAVSFNPNAAGFNLNPTETVIAQYSYQG